MNQTSEDLIKTEYHGFGEDQFFSGAAFVPRVGGSHEDDGWIISFVHDERSNTSQASACYIISHAHAIFCMNDTQIQIWIWICFFHVSMLQVHIIDAQTFEGAPVAKIVLPQRVPYGFHGTFRSSVANTMTWCNSMNTKPAKKWSV